MLVVVPNAGHRMHLHMFRDEAEALDWLFGTAPAGSAAVTKGPD